jgi:glucose/arabinose dehydrogenase
MAQSPSSAGQLGQDKRRIRIKDMRATRQLLIAAAGLGLVAGCAGDSGDDGTQPVGEPATSPSQPAAGSAEAITVGVEVVVDGVDLPNDLADLGDGRLLISDQRGFIYVFDNGKLLDEPLLDLTDRVLEPNDSGRQEVGLSGFAPHPDFADNGLIYVLFTEPGSGGSSRVDVLAEFSTAADPDHAVADPASERELLRLDQPRSVHVGGHMEFDDDGLLYVGLGDAGQPEFAQDPEALQGTIIRIDVEGDPYTVPDDNPFAAGGGAPEVFSYGFRNPFRVSWDNELGLIVTEPMFTSKDQEVNVAVSGGNFGYPDLLEQLPESSCYESETSTVPLSECVTGPDGHAFEPPVVEFAGRISSGAVRYSGEAIPELDGMVIAADWLGPMFVATPKLDQPRWLTTALEVEVANDGQWMSGKYIWALDRDADGEVYVLAISRTFDEGGGVVYRLTPA